MNKIFYTSDLHLGNANIIAYEHRPWKTVEEMNKALIDRWNQKVSLYDEVYVLGDFSFKRSQETVKFLSQMNGSNLQRIAELEAKVIVYESFLKSAGFKLPKEGKAKPE